MRFKLLRWVGPALGALLIAGAPACDDAQPTAGNAGAGAQAAPITTGGAGAIHGIVTFEGTPPPAERVEGAKCHSGAEAIETRPVVVSEQGGLADVVVFLKNPPATALAPSTDAPAVLDQVNCRYIPAAVALRAGQVLRVTSSDPTLHNVHMLPDKNRPANLSFTGAGQTKDLTFSTAESFKARCDVHHWMSAEIHVFDHPYFVVTGSDGSFEITNVPAGQYTLVFRHGFLGDREMAVQVAEDEVAQADQVFGKTGR